MFPTESNDLDPNLSQGNLKIRSLSKGDEIPFSLLELADPSRPRIREYLQNGECFTAELNGQVIGAFVLEPKDKDLLETMNISIEEAFQNQGFGKQLLKYISTYARQQGYKTLRICTGNSSIAQFALYQKVGFDLIEIERDHFLKNYEEEIWENGIRCRHLLVLEMEL